MSTRLSYSACRGPRFKGKIILAGQSHMVTVDPETRQRFIDNEEIDAFIERMVLLKRYDVLSDLAQIGYAETRGKQTLHSPRQTAFALHQARAMRN